MSAGPRSRTRPVAAILASASLLSVIALTGCRQTPGSGSHPTAAGTARPVVTLRGRFVKLTRWACHMSDNYVGGQRVTFTGSDGSSRTITTHSATWVGLPADPPRAPFGNCRQTARYEVRLPVATSYRIEINHYRFPPVMLDELRREGFRHTFHLPS